MYVRKTVDEWQLWINYGDYWEFETAEESRRDAIQQQKCYRENCPQWPTRIKCVRVPISKEKT
jgi:hypothetical protein